MAELKLIGCERFSSPKLGQNAITKGQVITVDDPGIVVKLLALHNRDIANNPHPLFEEVLTEAVNVAKAVPAPKQAGRKKIASKE